ncbi:UNKNOWN [Stylonychia lemnae]|uniref:Uncharacterized protein n=1 Tax=Stylonychia lemnae TaxID=5949 RepID=A0A077ZQ24_STYLE|nr:UNKNOWN [Stylonychia lemnae]|eukprot:CDW71480.1 UNKNOWN [Stylonychia lemnae]
MFNRKFFLSLCNCSRPSISNEQDIVPFYHEKVSVQLNHLNDFLMQNDSLVDFPLSTYIQETDDGCNKITPAKQNQSYLRIGSSEYIIKRKTPNQMFQEKIRLLDSLIPIKEEQDMEDRMSTHRKDLDEENYLLGQSNPSSKLLEHCRLLDTSSPVTSTNQNLTEELLNIDKYDIPEQDLYLIEDEEINENERRMHFALSQYKIIYLYFRRLLENQFDQNIKELLSNIAQVNVSVYQESLFVHQKNLSDRDMDIGLFENYEIPEWLNGQLADEINTELEEYILDMWSKNARELNQLSMMTDQLLLMIRCLAEDMIYDKYCIEIEQVYKYLQYYNPNDEDNLLGVNYQQSDERRLLSIKKQSGSNNKAMLSIFTIEETEEQNDSFQSQNPTY